MPNNEQGYFFCKIITKYLEIGTMESRNNFIGFYITPLTYEDIYFFTHIRNTSYKTLFASHYA